MTIDINTLNVGDVCPCGIGLVSAVSRGNIGAGFICRGSYGGATVRTTHRALPGGGYTNLTNVSVTPPRKTVKEMLRERCDGANRFAFDPAKFPHTCPTCRGPVYRGFSVIEHAATGNARCP